MLKLAYLLELLVVCCVSFEWNASKAFAANFKLSCNVTKMLSKSELIKALPQSSRNLASNLGDFIGSEQVSRLVRKTELMK